MGDHYGRHEIEGWQQEGLYNKTPVSSKPMVQQYIEKRIYNAIPEMNDPLGKYWDQPSDLRTAPMNSHAVLLTRYQFEHLGEYSSSIPSGVYPGKCWKCWWPDHPKKSFEPGKWYLRWYAEDKDPKMCQIHKRLIVIGRLK